MLLNAVSVYYSRARLTVLTPLRLYVSVKFTMIYKYLFMFMD